MKLSFTKMQGCGNDYIYLNCMEEEPPDPAELSIRLSDRHFGIGGDGIILICPSKIADAKMRIFNADGSEGKMCGNGVRCVGKYLYDSGIAPREEIRVDTLSGVKLLRMQIRGGKAVGAQVDMGNAVLTPEKIPVCLIGEAIVNYPAEVGGRQWNITCVSMGNPHCVVFCENVAELDLEEIGVPFEKSPLFPESVNTEFVRVVERNHLEMRVWERGSGETLACGTGACASAVAAVRNGFCDPDEDITVELRGGVLTIRCTEKTVSMTGPAETVFTGEVELQPENK